MRYENRSLPLPAHDPGVNAFQLAPDGAFMRHMHSSRPGRNTFRRAPFLEWAGAVEAGPGPCSLAC